MEQEDPINAEKSPYISISKELRELSEFLVGNCFSGRYFDDLELWRVNWAKDTFA